MHTMMLYVLNKLFVPKEHPHDSLSLWCHYMVLESIFKISQELIQVGF